jgi:hypothetical protein
MYHVKSKSGAKLSEVPTHIKGHVIYTRGHVYVFRSLVYAQSISTLRPSRLSTR